MSQRLQLPFDCRTLRRIRILEFDLERRGVKQRGGATVFDGGTSGDIIEERENLGFGNQPAEKSDRNDDVLHLNLIERRFAHSLEGAENDRLSVPRCLPQIDHTLDRREFNRRTATGRRQILVPRQKFGDAHTSGGDQCLPLRDIFRARGFFVVGDQRD